MLKVIVDVFVLPEVLPDLVVTIKYLTDEVTFLNLDYLDVLLGSV